jgi:hypothetical protein
MMGPPKNDALVIYLRPFHRGAGSADLAEKQRVLQLWVRMFRIYGDSQPPFSPPAECRKLGLSMDKNSLRDWDVNIAKHVSGPEDQQNAQLNAARDCLPNAIELRVQPLPPLPDGGPGAGNLVYQAPVMRTYSALGILKNATERQNPRIEFVTPQIYNQIRGDRWNDDADSSSYYTLLPSELDSVNCSEERRRRGGCETPPIPSSERDMFNSQIDRWIRNFATGGPTYPSGLDVYEASGSDVLDPQFINMNGRLGTLRRYVLIIVDDRLPKSRAYASYFDGSKWYYIDKDDTVSEKNFQLLALFMTMMAVPPSTPPLSPTINVGG